MLAYSQSEFEKIKPVSKNRPVSKNETDLTIEPQHIGSYWTINFGVLAIRAHGGFH